MSIILRKYTSMQGLYKQSAYDYIFILLPGFFAIPFYYLMVKGLGVSWVILVLGLWIFDPGHSYAMFLRTYLNPKELRRTKVHYIAPLVIAIIIFVWHFASIPFLFSAIFYYSAYHYIRQFYGFFRIYESKSKHRLKYSPFILYSLLLLPTLGMHFRHDIEIEYFEDVMIQMFPSVDLYNAVLVLWWSVFVGGLLYETKNYQKGSGLRLASIFAPGILFYITTLHLAPARLILFSLITAHSIPYIAILIKSMPITNEKFYNKTWKSVAFVLLAVLTLGPLGAWTEWEFDLDNSYLQYRDLSISIIAALILMPGILHYFIDSIIWKGNHPEAKLIFGSKSRK